METVKQLLEYWPFLMFVVAIGVIAQVIKQIFTPKLAGKSTIVFWIRRIMPLILVLIGIVTGLLWSGEPSPGIDTTPERILYFAGAACVSITAFSAFKNWIKKKYDVDLGTDEVQIDESGVEK
jgi:ABC-type amino acid transport system permease subunit